MILVVGANGGTKDVGEDVCWEAFKITCTLQLVNVDF